MKNNNKTSLDHWNENWRRASSNAVSEESGGVGTYFWECLKKNITKAISKTGVTSGKLIEIGAGGSEYLILLHRTYGFDVDGLDYSDIGCETTRKILLESNITGEVYLADMFSPPSDLMGKYDVVSSFGLIEHFEDTRSAVEACAKFLKPGGLIITTIPNMSGLYGWLYRFYDRNVYKMHVPLTLNSLKKAHLDCGLDIICTNYILGLPGVMDGGRFEPNRLKNIFRKIAHKFTKWYWILEKNNLGVPKNAVTSPYMLCIASKKN